MLNPKSFLYEQQKGIGTITLNRPDRLNAITFEVYHELTDFIAQLRDENDLRVVVITGAGRAFCSGGDVIDIIGELTGRDAEGLLDFTRLTCDLIRNMRALPKPIVASLNGTVAGAGACIALASDIRVAAEEAKIAFIFVKVGLAGTDMGATYLLPRVVGLAKATELLMAGDFVEAREAERIGLYNRVVPREQLGTATREFAEKLANGPAVGIAKTKEMLNREMHMSFESALEAEAVAQALCMQTPDFKEAHAAFVEKRPAKFK
ncbi:MAG TPA: enoyl-CoA hydratase family protein [Pyrinomonadaceae bacterium]|jgi:enoyl-CoA hydratase/carnithine racemase|nr:enoyl-CoA hydratase family protein [Pyrinomonadaceae bacterium]